MSGLLIDTARRLNLQFNGGTQLIGQREGNVVVRLQMHGTTAQWCAAEVPAQGFDEHLTLDDVPPEVQPSRGVLEHGWLIDRRLRSEAQIPGALVELCQGARQLATWWKSPLEELLADFGLVPNEDRGVFSGEVRGVEVRLREGRNEQGFWQGFVEGRLHVPLPGGTILRAARPHHAGTPLPDLILDGQLDIQGPIPDLGQDDVRGVLLSLVHNHRGSVTSEWVRAAVPSLRATAAIRAALNDVVDLVLGLATPD